ncbi:MAG: hypothetical protein JSU68_01000 [Phycisphaerales bacterium]|nr:MAG: hypothetical protein JSU68_01000 [Phycisphaerales bacterium]
MIYAAMTGWLLVIIFTAWGVHRLWTGLIPPRVVNSALLPGTFVAQVGRVLGLLATGGTIDSTALVKDDGSAEPQAPADPRTRIPVLGPIIVALLPLVACGAAIYLVASWLGRETVLALGQNPVAEQLPVSLAAVFQLLRDGLSQAENLGRVVIQSDFGAWQTWMFVYLAICFTVRMAPLEGNLRGAIGATVLLGLLAALVGGLSPAGLEAVVSGWPILSFSVTALLLLLLISLAMRGLVGLVRLLMSGA